MGFFHDVGDGFLVAEVVVMGFFTVVMVGFLWQMWWCWVFFFFFFLCVCVVLVRFIVVEVVVMGD